MTLAPSSTSQIGLTPRRGTPRLAAPTAEMTPFPEQIATEVKAFSLFTLQMKERPAEVARATRPAAVAKTEVKRPGPVPMAEMPIVTPPKGKLATIYPVATFQTPVTGLVDYEALPFRQKFVIGVADQVMPLVAAAAAGVADIPEPSVFPGLEDLAPAPSRPSTPKLDELTAAAKPKVQQTRKDEPAPAVAEKKESKPARSFTAPSLGGVEGEGGILGRVPLVGWLALGAVVLIGVVFFVMTGKKADKGVTADSVPSMQDIAAGQSMAGSGWLTDYAIGAGQTRARQLIVFRESMGLQNYRLNFNVQVQNRAVSWIFRAADMKNYYAMKLELGTGPNGQASLYKFAVVNGEEGPRLKIPVPFPVKNDTILRITEDVRGPQFRVFIQNQPLDTWQDTQIKTGGVGFMRERGEQANILGVEILK